MSRKFVLSIFYLACFLCSYFFTFRLVLADESYEVIRDPLTNNVLAIKSFANSSETPHRRLVSDNKDYLILHSDALIKDFASKYNAYPIDVAKELKPLGVSVDSLGNSKVVYQQIVNQIDLYGSRISVHFDRFDNFKMIKGVVEQGFDPNAGYLISSQRAVTIIKNKALRSKDYKRNKKFFRKGYLSDCRKRHGRGSLLVSACLAKRLKKYDRMNSPVVLHVPRLYIEKTEDSNTSRVFWEFVLGGDGVNSETVRVDANTAEIFHRKSDEQHATQRAIYDCGHHNQSTENQRMICYKDILTNFYGAPFYYGRGEGKPPVGPSPNSNFLGSTDVDYFYETLIPQFNDFLMDKFGRDGPNSFGGTNFPIKNYPSRMDFIVFANTDKTTPGEMYCSRPYGGAWKNLSGLSVCSGVRSNELFAHELSHNMTDVLDVHDVDGATNWTVTRLGVTGETGAIGENFGDVLGELYEKVKTGTNDWIYMPEAGNDGRNAINPAALSYTPVFSNGNSYPPRPYPDNYNSPNMWCYSSFDDGGIHVNSTVLFKAAYLASQGGTFNGCSIQGIGLEKVAQIWYRAMFTYYGPKETFRGAYIGLTQACDDLAADPNSLLSQDPPLIVTQSDCVNLIKALQAVELDKSGACAGQVPGNPTCAVQNPNPLPGDYNKNGSVTLEDYDLMKKEIYGILSTKESDGNNNSRLDVADYEIWLVAYFGANPPKRPTIQGDFNYDLSVDGADFLVWQRSLGQTGPALDCDANVDGVVDHGDLQVWKDRFGTRY